MLSSIAFLSTRGDAENLNAVQGLKEAKFDTVLNVESSHCYGNLQSIVFLKAFLF